MIDPEKQQVRRKPGVDPEANFHAFVEHAKRVNVFGAVEWDADSWDITKSAKKARSHDRKRQTLHFSEIVGRRRGRSQRRIAFIRPFADLVKAVVCSRQERRTLVPAQHISFLRAARYLYEVAPLPIRMEPTKLAREHFLAAANLLEHRESVKSCYLVGKLLVEFSKVLDRHAVTRVGIEFPNPFKRPTDLARVMDHGGEEYSDEIIPDEVLDALADLASDPELYNRLADLVMMRISELSLVLGFRIGENLTIPKDPLVREPVLSKDGTPEVDPESGDPVMRLGLRYWPEKGAEPIVKWIPTFAQEIVLRALTDIETVCGPARETAAWLEAHPKDVKLDLPGKERLRRPDVEKLLGLAPGCAGRWFAGRPTAPQGDHRQGHWSITAADFKRAAATDRYDEPCVVIDGVVKQTLSQSLFVVHLHELNRQRGTNRFIAMPITGQMISDFLGARSASIFERELRTERGGSKVKVKTHDFRRLLNTAAMRGGLNELELARWMGRADLRQNAAYDKRTPSEMARAARKLALAGELYGPIIDVINAMPKEQAEEVLRTHVNTVHITRLGLCRQDLAERPCPIAGACMTGCGQYIRIKGDEKSRDALLVDRERLSVALDRAEEHARAGKRNAENWVRTQRAQVENIDKALAIDARDDLADGTPVYVNPDGATVGKPWDEEG